MRKTLLPNISSSKYTKGTFVFEQIAAFVTALQISRLLFLRGLRVSPYCTELDNRITLHTSGGGNPNWVNNSRSWSANNE